MERYGDIKVIVFDADDTLWDCQGHFDEVERQYAQMLSPWATAEQVHRELVSTEMANMPSLGYGCKAFTLSLIETAIRVSGEQVSAAALKDVMRLGRSLLELPATPLPTVEETLEALYSEGRYRLAVFTKGELLDQENKLRRSGLQRFFEHVEIVSDKTRHAYLSLCRRLRIAPRQMLMVGNSYKSDIEPALSIGAWAAYIPYHLTWQLEHADEVDHPRMSRLGKFDELATILKNT